MATSITITTSTASSNYEVTTSARGPAGPAGAAGASAWGDITGKPSTFAPVIGAGAADAVAGNDARLHARAHSVTSGSDHTFPGGISDFLRADGTFAAPPGGTVDNASVNAAIEENEIATLRSAKASGFNSLTAPNTQLWRIVNKLRKAQTIVGGKRNANRFRITILGDSVACNPTGMAQGYWGYGGLDINLPSWIGSAAPVPTDSGGPVNYPSWAQGVYNLYDEWARTPSATVRNLDHTLINANYVEKIGDLNMGHSLVVRYLAGDDAGAGDASYGSFKLQYKIRNAGSWIDCTTADIYLPGVAAAAAPSGVVNTDLGPGAAERNVQVVFKLPKYDFYDYRIITTAGRVRLTKTFLNSGAMEAPANNQHGAMSGAIGFDYSVGGRQLASHFSLTPQSVWNDVLALDDPMVIIYKSANGWSLVNYQTHWPAYAAKLRAAAPDAALIVCGSHSMSSGAGHFHTPSIEVDDYLREWCSTNEGAIFVDVRQNFPEYGRQGILSGATGADAADINGLIASDGLWLSVPDDKQSYSKTIGANTITLRHNGTAWIVAHNGQTRFTAATVDLGGFPLTFTGSNGSTGTLAFGGYNTVTGLIDDLWSDGTHIYGIGSDWVASLVWNAILPACDAVLRNWDNINDTMGATLPYPINEIRLTDGINSHAQQNILAVRTHPAVPSEMILRPMDAIFNGGNQLYGEHAGFGMSADNDADSARSLVLFSAGLPVMRFGRHVALPINQYMGAHIGGGTYARSKSGLRVLQAGTNPALTAEGVSGAALSTPIFAIDTGASTTVQGTPIYSWITNKAMVVHGSGTAATHFRHEDPTTVSVVSDYIFGSPTVTVASAAGLSVGMRINIGFPATAQIVSIVGTTVTMSENANSTANTTRIWSGLEIFTPVNAVAGTGVRSRVIGVVPSFATNAARVTAGTVAVGDVWYDESTKKVKCLIVAD